MNLLNMKLKAQRPRMENHRHLVSILTYWPWSHNLLVTYITTIGLDLGLPVRVWGQCREIQDWEWTLPRMSELAYRSHGAIPSFSNHTQFAGHVLFSVVTSSLTVSRSCLFVFLAHRMRHLAANARQFEITYRWCNRNKYIKPYTWIPKYSI